MEKYTIVVFFVFFVNTISAADIQHNISTSSLTISSGSTDNYIITGTTSVNYVLVQRGYKGTITLRNVSITSSSYSPITVIGENNRSNFTPITNVDIILEGNNTLTYTGYSGYAALQVDQGAQINISSALQQPNGYTIGSLTAKVTNSSGGAGIGGLTNSASNSQQGSADITGGCSTPDYTCGGNIIIESGNITAQGGHGAGIGGGFSTYYNGMIVIYGGTINASSIRHAAGIGSGCPTGIGVIQCYTPNSAIVVLPPSQISATGATGYEFVPVPNLGLAGTRSLTYIGDPAKPLITVRTEDYTSDANIYVDLSESPEIATVINAIVPTNKMDINQVSFGSTNSSGIYTFNGILNNNTTFFTDAVSQSPATLGKPYLPEIVYNLQTGGEVILKLLPTDLACKAIPSSPLKEGYTDDQAQTNASRVKITYSDTKPMTDIVFELANTMSDFSELIFYDSDSITPIAPPTTLKYGDIIYIAIPLKTEKLVGVYSEVLRFSGKWEGSSTDNIRQIVEQKVVHPEYITICKNELPYTYADSVFNKGGVYEIPFSSIAGKDSLVELTLTVNPTYNLTDTVTICDNELPFTYRDTVFSTGTSSGDYIFQRKTINGCDSTVTLTLTVNPTYNLTEDTVICDSDLPFTWRDTVFSIGTNSGDYIFQRKTINGCDSIVTLQLTVNPTYNLTETAAVCDNEFPFTWRDTVFSTGTTSGDFTFYRKTLNGCDSTVTLTLTVNPTYNLTEDTVICDSELPFTWRDTVFSAGTTSGDYIFQRKTVNGCDSIVTLTLTVNPTFDLTETAAICDNEFPFTWRDTVFSTGTSSGDYIFQRETVNGCDSTVTLTLTVNPTYNLTETAVICDSELPFTWRDTVFSTGTTSGDYIFQRKTVNGCDSIVTLTLTVNPTYNLTETAAVCDNEFPFTWRDTVFSAGTTSGDYIFQRKTINGCDSIVTLHLTVMLDIKSEVSHSLINCKTHEYQFDAILDIPQGVSIKTSLWTFPEDYVETNKTSVTYQFKDSGSFEVNYRVSTMEDCENSYTEIVHVPY
ncbi:MAG: hypothetical protein LBM07_05455, partial [Culturomica sp.]|nr:hypothetical protein [Culturomica sp.]